MKLFPYSYRHVDDHLHVWVSNHYCYSDFGIRFRNGGALQARRFVCTGAPGTGFVERESESRSYHDFVSGHASVRPPSYLGMLLGREPSFKREMRLVEGALRRHPEGLKRELLECYSNALGVGRGGEFLQRVVNGVKAKMGHRNDHRMSAAIGRYRQRISQLEKDMDSVVYRLEDHYSPEVMQAYGEMCDAFVAMIRRCRRIWHHRNKGHGGFSTVFFDMGVFDYIRSDHLLPVMRDSAGRCMYLLPDCLLLARSSVDFEVLPLKSTTIVWQEMAIQEPTELLTRHRVDAACMIQLPTLGTAFYFNHARVVVAFVQAMNRLKELL